MTWIYSRWVIIGGLKPHEAREALSDLELGQPGPRRYDDDRATTIDHWIGYGSLERSDQPWMGADAPFWPMALVTYVADPHALKIKVKEPLASLVGVASPDPAANLDALLVMQDRLLSGRDITFHRISSRLSGRELLQLEGLQIRSVETETDYGHRIDRFSSREAAKEHIESARDYVAAVALGHGGAVTIFPDDQLAFSGVVPAAVTGVLASVAPRTWRVSE